MPFCPSWAFIAARRAGSVGLSTTTLVNPSLLWLLALPLAGGIASPSDPPLPLLHLPSVSAVACRTLAVVCRPLDMFGCTALAVLCQNLSY